MAMDEQRFIDIETKLVHQEVILEDLHQVLYKQQEIIDLLQKKIKAMDEQFQSQNEIRAAGEKPPHY
jgi:SlyX protein